MTNWLPDITGHEIPRYRAIADALAEDVSRGVLKPGTRLPTHRELAYHLKVTVGTVTRAYAEAERRGLIGGEVGRGTFVRCAERSEEELRVAETDPPGEIDLSVNQPGALGIRDIMAETLATLAERVDFDTLMRYQPYSGMAAHRAAGAAWMERFGVRVPADRVLVCGGGQNAMATALMALSTAGDTILCEQLTYTGVKVLAASIGVRLHGLEMDEHGLVPEAFEMACRATRSRVLYTMPTLHNPTLNVMPEERRIEIVRIARNHGVTIVEDDVYGCFLQDGPPSFATLAPELTAYFTSLSKGVAPGLRVGYLTAPEELLRRMGDRVRAVSWMSPPLTTELATQWIETGIADRLVAARRGEAAISRKLACDILGAFAGQPPEAATHLWLKLPEPWRRDDFVDELARRHIKVTAADAFMVGRTPTPHAVRISLCAARGREDLACGLTAIRDLLSESPFSSQSVV